MKKLFEEYVESADYKINVFFKELEAQINRWFNKGSLAAQGCEIDGEIQISNYNPMEKFLIFNFVEPVEPSEENDGTSYRYRVTFMVRLDQMKGGKKDDTQEETEDGQVNPKQGEITSTGMNLDIDKVLLKIHQFNEENEQKGELVEEVSIGDIKEDFLIDKIGQLKDKSEDGDVDSNDLKDDIHTL